MHGGREAGGSGPQDHDAIGELLDECRRELGQALAAPAPDPAALLELRTEERLLQERARA